MVPEPKWRDRMSMRPTQHAAPGSPAAAPAENAVARPEDAKPDWAKSDRERARDAQAAAGAPVRRRRWPWVVILLLVLGAAGYALVTMRAAPPPPADAADERVMEINPDEWATLAPRRLEKRVRATGTLAPWRSTQVSSQTGGEIETVTVRPGDSVRAGDLLVQVDVESLTIERNQARSNAAATRAQLALAEAQRDRTFALVERGVTTSSNLDEAQSAVARLRASLDALADQEAAAELRLRNATVRAPIDGIVSTRTVDPGQFVGVGAALIGIVDLSRVELQANAAVADGALLSPGQPVAVAIDGAGGRSYDGRVARIAPVAASGTRTIPVFITIDNSDGMLLGGMFATAQVVVEAVDDAIAVPTSALREDAEGAHVLRIEGDRLVRQPVETGDTWAGRLTRITAGLEAGQRVVTAPLPMLHPGDRVTLVER
jgi:RND family efflux transporter MFP subunit